jgi:hypothetical protein
MEQNKNDKTGLEARIATLSEAGESAQVPC